jgi:3-oxoacyl-[acyl-carrier-protein] synthase-3
MSSTIKARPRSFSRISGLGIFRPERVVTNDEICQKIESSDEWIRERSGIIERRFADADTTIIDMSVAAAELAIADAGLTAQDIDAIYVATLSHPYQTPSAAVLIADRLGLDNPGAVDISAACSGFTYAVGIADGLVSIGQHKNVLVIGVEKLSDWVDPYDRGTAFLFADGAGAVVVSQSDVAAIGPTINGSNGGEWEAIVCFPDWLSLRDDARKNTVGAWPVLHMQGQKVFRWAVTEMVPVCKAALEAAGVTMDDLDLFIPHQANMRITDALVRGLALPDSVAIARDIATAGNTSAASIPLAMDRMRSEGVAKSGDLALLVGFGAGLAYSAQVVRIP